MTVSSLVTFQPIQYMRCNAATLEISPLENPNFYKNKENRGQFAALPYAIVHESRITSSEFRLLAYLFTFNKVIDPTYAQIADNTGMSQPTITKAIDGLCAIGILVQTKLGLRCEYQVLEVNPTKLTRRGEPHAVGDAIRAQNAKRKRVFTEKELQRRVDEAVAEERKRTGAA